MNTFLQGLALVAVFISGINLGIYKSDFRVIKDCQDNQYTEIRSKGINCSVRLNVTRGIK